jgi:8-oxo-dGTP pyrophosphatase MutT (NUDIX family)
MGAGILPTTIYKNKLYFLFGKENKYEDSAPGFSDFGGGKDNDETHIQTAIREGVEELTGFLGSDKDVTKLLKQHGTYNIDHITNNGRSTYRIHIFPFEYDPKLPFYYNNNQRFLQKRLAPEVIKNTKIFEKEEIRWICIDDLKKMKPQFRFFFAPIIDQICNERDEIQRFITKGLGSSNLKKRTTAAPTKKQNNRQTKTKKWRLFT